MLVFSMGIVLIGGTVFLVALIWQAVTNPKTTTSAAKPCHSSVVDVRDRGNISQYFLQGNHLFAVVKTVGKPDNILVIDHCTGDVQRVITLQDVVSE